MLVKTLYKDEEGMPIILSDGQCELFIIIFQKRHPRVHLMAHTQYGKSHTVALAILTRIATFPEKWSIVAGTGKQANIIMGYIIQHCFDNDFTKSKLEISSDENIERVRRERSKKRLTFRHSDGGIGEVFVLSADGRNKQDAGKSVMGFGAPNVVLDEAALIEDLIEAKIFRMLAGKPDSFYLKIGNPFNRNHFHKSFIDSNYLKMNIDWHRGLIERRITQSFINEAMLKPEFEVLYENKFPEADMIDDAGYVPLLTVSDLRKGVDTQFIGRKRMGVDPAGMGNDEAAWVARDKFKAKVLATELKSTEKTIAHKTIVLASTIGTELEDTYVDNFGTGANVAQEIALAVRRARVRGVNVNDDADDKERFLNKRAEAYWRLRDWLKAGAELIGDGWEELLNIKYTHTVDGRIKIMGKNEMRRRGIKSPNKADALMLTFYDREISNEEIEASDSIDTQYNAFGEPINNL